MDMKEPAPESLLKSVWEVMDGNWNASGYTAPNPDVYPYLWLWDSCFHVLIWAKLAETGKSLGFQNQEKAKMRACEELENIFEAQDELGFIPHINYFAKPNRKLSRWARRWGRTHSSSISQPPMYGHTIAELHRWGGNGAGISGVGVSEEIIQKAAKGLDFFFTHRKRDPKSGLLYLCHPWESGVDDSPRWDDYVDSHKSGSQKKKLKLLKSLELSSFGSALFNPAFPVVSAGFNALIAFNALELAEITGDSGLESEALQIAEALKEKFSPELQTWIDGTTPSAKVRTLDALLAGLVDIERAPAILSQLSQPNAFGGEFGPPSVSRAEPSFKPDVYWRGSAWPQMNYLFWIFCKRLKSDAGQKAAESLEAAFKRGVNISNYSEHWSADTGKGLGAQPQSWTCLILLLQ